MDIQITNAEAEDGWQQHGTDGQTRWIKTLPATNPAFQAALAHTCHNVRWNDLYVVRHTKSSQDQQQRVVSFPAANVEYFSGKLNSYQLKTHRPSYVNAVLIQTRGVANANPCSMYSLLICRTTTNDRIPAECRDHAYRGPFLECVSLPYDWSVCCGNCKFKDWAAKCSLNDGSRPDRYRTTPYPAGYNGNQPNNPPAAAPAGLLPVIHEVTDTPYDIEEPEDEERPPGVVRHLITDGR
jgi:hypothetical protein